MDLDRRIDNIGDFIQGNYDNCRNWIAIIGILILSSCRMMQPANGELGFIFSETQFKIYGHIGYFRSKYGKIFPFTDYVSNKHCPNRYSDSMFIGYGTVVRPVDKDQVVWPRLSHISPSDYE